MIQLREIITTPRSGVGLNELLGRRPAFALPANDCSPVKISHSHAGTRGRACCRVRLRANREKPGNGAKVNAGNA